MAVEESFKLALVLSKKSQWLLTPVHLTDQQYTRFTYSETLPTLCCMSFLSRNTPQNILPALSLVELAHTSPRKENKSCWRLLTTLTRTNSGDKEQSGCHTREDSRTVIELHGRENWLLCCQKFSLSTDILPLCQWNLVLFTNLYWSLRLFTCVFTADESRN